jgi:hypothetical protein
MVPVYAISSVTSKILYIRLLAIPISQLLELSFNSVGLFGGQLVVSYDFPLVVLQTISMIFSTCDGA